MKQTLANLSSLPPHQILGELLRRCRLDEARGHNQSEAAAVLGWGESNAGKQAVYALERFAAESSPSRTAWVPPARIPALANYCNKRTYALTIIQELGQLSYEISRNPQDASGLKKSLQALTADFASLFGVSEDNLIEKLLAMPESKHESSYLKSFFNSELFKDAGDTSGPLMAVDISKGSLFYRELDLLSSDDMRNEVSDNVVIIDHGYTSKSGGNEAHIGAKWVHSLLVRTASYNSLPYFPVIIGIDYFKRSEGDVCKRMVDSAVLQAACSHGITDFDDEGTRKLLRQRLLPWCDNSDGEQGEILHAEQGRLPLLIIVNATTDDQFEYPLRSLKRKICKYSRLVILVGNENAENSVDLYEDALVLGNAPVRLPLTEPSALGYKTADINQGDSLQLLVESSAVGEAIHSLVIAAKNSLIKPVLDVDVDIVLGSYDFLIKNLESPNKSNFDSVVVPHISLFRHLNEAKSLEVVNLPNRPEFEFDSVLFPEDESGVREQGFPIHLPTRVLAINNSGALSQGDNSESWLDQFCNGKNSKFLLQGIKGKNDPSLYYEFLSWCYLNGATLSGETSDECLRHAASTFLKMANSESLTNENLNWYSIIEQMHTNSMPDTLTDSACMIFTDTLGQLVERVEASNTAFISEATTSSENMSGLGFSIKPMWTRRLGNSKSPLNFAGESRLKSPFACPTPFTLHVAVALKENASEPLARFLSWFYSDEIQVQFSERSLEAPIIPHVRREILSGLASGQSSLSPLRQQALRASCLAHEFARVNEPENDFEIAKWTDSNSSKDSETVHYGLNTKQSLIRGFVSKAIKDAADNGLDLAVKQLLKNIKSVCDAESDQS